MEYAILYKKEIYDKKKGIFVLKPCQVIAGISDQRNHYFLDEKNEERIFADDDKILLSSTQFCVGSTINEEELMAQFPDAKNIEEAKENLLKEIQDYLTIGIYKNGRLTTTSLLINDFSIDMLQTDDRNLEDPSYQKLKSRFDREDFTLFTKEEMDVILKANSVEEIRNMILNIMNQKETYQKKLDMKQSSGLCIRFPDDVLQDLLCEEKVEKIKEQLKISFDKASKKQEMLNHQEGMSLLEFYQDIYNKMILKTSIQELRTFLKTTLINYDTIFEILGLLPLTNQDFNSCKKLLTLQYTMLQKIMTYQVLEQAIYDYKSFYESSIPSITQASELLKENGFLLYLQNEVENTDISEKRLTALEEKIQEKLTFDYLKTYQYMISKLLHRNEQVDAILSTICKVDYNPNKDKKSACLIAGTPGTGKTQTFMELKRILSNRPVVIADTNQITSQGYSGGSIEDVILKRLVEEAHLINKRFNPGYSDKITEEDIVLAEHGIVFLDEIDKRRENLTDGPDVNGKGVIDQLLKLMDGTTYQVNIGDSFITAQMISFDTSSLVVFAGGAFEEYFELQDKKVGYQSEKDQKEKFTKYLEVNPEDLVKYGLSSQFIGRCNRALLYPPHTKESLLELEKNKKTSNLENQRILFEQEGVMLVWKEDFLEAVVEEAVTLKKGGRGLNHIISRCLDHVYSEIRKYPGQYKIVYLDAHVVKNPDEVLLIKKNENFVYMKDIKARNKEEAEKQCQVSQIEVNKEAYSVALSYVDAIKQMNYDVTYDSKMKTYTLKNKYDDC